MYRPSRSEFKELAKEHDVIPIYREVVADVETPVSAFIKIAKDGDGFLLESAEYGERFGRYSFLGAGARAVITAKGTRVEIKEDGRVDAYEAENPLVELKRFMARKPAPALNLPGFYGGAVGYLGYDSVRRFERLPEAPPGDPDIPDMAFMIMDTVLVFDHLKHKLIAVSNARVNGDPSAAYDAAVAAIEKELKALEEPIAVSPLGASIPFNAPMRGSVNREQFCEMVGRAKEYISAGDIFQVVLSQSFSAKLEAEPFDVYRVLRTINPSPYMAFIKMGELSLAGASPEPLISVTGKRVVTRPIAGTRPRGETEAEDKALAEELLADEKERAEHIMLVDLGRNDLGRVCAPGSVEVEELMVVERYSHVMHIVSTVAGELSEGMTAIEALQASFPAGTVSGAPKIRAMEIIDELEPIGRGPYAGVYGYLGHTGDLDCGITIRTVVMKEGVARVQAGAGIVADSVPDREYDECVNKARALFSAVVGANAFSKTGQKNGSRATN